MKKKFPDSDFLSMRGQIHAHPAPTGIYEVHWAEFTRVAFPWFPQRGLGNRRRKYLRLRVKSLHVPMNEAIRIVNVQDDSAS